MKKGSIAAAFVAASFCFGPAAFAKQENTAPAETSQQQTEQKFSEEELKSFVEANIKATEIQKEGREAVVATIEEQKLTLDRFNELAKAHQQKKLQETAENPEEIAAFSNAAQAVVKIQPETMKKVEQAIEEAGLTQEKYDAILKAYEQDEAVKAQVQAIVSAQQ
jgi:hypothetical protein